MSKYLKEIETNPSQMLKKKKKTLKNEKKIHVVNIIIQWNKTCTKMSHLKKMVLVQLCFFK